MLRRTTVKNHQRTASVAEGGGDEGRRIEEERRRYDKGNQLKNPPAGRHRGGGRDEKAKTNTKWKGGTTHSPARGASAELKTHNKEKRNNMHHKIT